MITLIEAKRHLRVDSEAEDADIELKLRMADALVEGYLNTRFVRNSYVFSEDISDAAKLLVLGELYANREAGSDPLSPTVRGILSRLRIPTLT